MRPGTVYLIRHGQAGSRQKYDELSELGRLQAARLGQFWAAKRRTFATVLAGGLMRQQETARMAGAGLASPAMKLDARWSEFDLDEVYRGIAPVLAASDPQFARQHEELQREMERADSRVHRHWTPCDMAVFLAWAEGRIRFDGESFADFCGRVRAASDDLYQLEKPAAVFSSATPISLVLGWAEGMTELAAMQFAGAMWNAAWSELEVDSSGIHLVSFNNIDHLDESLRTKR